MTERDLTEHPCEICGERAVYAMEGTDEKGRLKLEWVCDDHMPAFDGVDDSHIYVDDYHIYD